MPSRAMPRGGRRWVVPRRAQACQVRDGSGVPLLPGGSGCGMQWQPRSNQAYIHLTRIASAGLLNVCPNLVAIARSSRRPRWSSQQRPHMRAVGVGHRHDTTRPAGNPIRVCLDRGLGGPSSPRLLVHPAHSRRVPRVRLGGFAGCGFPITMRAGLSPPCEPISAPTAARDEHVGGFFS